MHETIALVTGASSGIGEEFCRQLAGRCDRIIAVARRGERLEALAQELAGATEVVPVLADLSGVEGVTRAVEALRQKGPVSYLVNNAGFSTLGPFARSDLDEEQAMMRVHLDASISLCRAALPAMIEAGGGTIINVASVGAFLPMRSTSVYGACKAFLSSFSTSLQEEVAGKGVRVQCLCPGFTRTGIHDTPSFAGFDKSQVPDAMWMEVAEVVTASLEALDSGQVQVIPGEQYRSMVRDTLQKQAASLQ